MDYKIIDIEGVGDVYAKKLVAAGINKVSELLEKCAAPKGRKELADATGISEKLILRWTNHADLFRINGVGPQFAELLEKAGVDTVKEFRHRVAENLQPKLEEINAEFHICGDSEDDRPGQGTGAEGDILSLRHPITKPPPPIGKGGFANREALRKNLEAPLGNLVRPNFPAEPPRDHLLRESLFLSALKIFFPCTGKSFPLHSRKSVS